MTAPPEGEELNLSVIASQCHLPYRGEALAFRKVFLPSSKFSSPPEAPLLGELSAKQTERLYEGEAGRKPLLDSTSPSALTRCHLPYRGEALAVPAK